MNKEMKLPPIQYNTFIDDPPERVYDTLTIGEGWEVWFTQGAKVDARPGGTMLFRWVDFKVDHFTSKSKGPALEAIAPKQFVFRWTAEILPPPSSLTLSPWARVRW
jgi:uncharacterized protein YndB with AHSA1/START domain